MFGLKKKKKEKRPFVDPLYTKYSSKLTRNAQATQMLKRWELGLPSFDEIEHWFATMPAEERDSILAKLPKFPSWWLGQAFKKKDKLPMIIAGALLAPAFPLIVFYFLNHMNDGMILDVFGWWPIIIMIMALLAWRMLSYSEVATRNGWCIHDPLSAKIIENIYLMEHGPNRDMPKPDVEEIRNGNLPGNNVIPISVSENQEEELETQLGEKDSENKDQKEQQDQEILVEQNKPNKPSETIESTEAEKEKNIVDIQKYREKVE